MAVPLEVFHRLPVRLRAEALVRQELPESHVHLMPFRGHDELAGHVAISAGGAGKSDVRQCRIRLDAAVQQRESGDLFARSRITVEMVEAGGRASVGEPGVADHRRGPPFAKATTDAL